MSCKHPCPQCPWRIENQGKRHFGSFFTKANLTRLWNGVRKGNSMSCHMTDPNHPDHIKSGAPINGTPQECPGSVVLVMREIAAMADADNVVTPETLKRYQEQRRRGLTKRGVNYWLIERMKFGGVPFVGAPKLPIVDINEPGVLLPPYLESDHG